MKQDGCQQTSSAFILSQRSVVAMETVNTTMGVIPLGSGAFGCDLA